MRRAISVVTGLLVSLFAAAHTSRAREKTAEFSVQASAAVQASPARITLHWPQDATTQPKSYTVYRKAPGGKSWGKIAVLPGTATQYVDHNVNVGQGYEYQIAKSTAHYNGYGYVYAGINLPLTENRGRLLLVVDKTYAATLAQELTRLQQDLVGDGWTVARLEVERNDSVVSVKNRIKAEYRADTINTRAVFLFGHVPVAYSGDIVPDGHVPDHQGAWPSDGYYGDMDGAWTDNSVTDVTAADARNRNVPGDGKFDQSTFPAPLKLMVGRVDLANMPGRMTAGGAATFPSEVELLRNYLNKDHAFRTKQIDAPRRGVVGDYFGVRDGEAFAASGWRNLASFFNAEKVTTLENEGTWINCLHTNSYLWAYGCGPGSFTSIGGLGNSDSYHDGITTEFYRNDPKAVFTLLYGSWLGDWDSEDNFQRAVLALPSLGLTCGWSGRPHWFMHHMAMGEPIGFSTLLTQNNRSEGLYRNEQNNCAGQIHIALMGDPTLRMHIVAPASGVESVNNGKGVDLNWKASADDVLGYHVYRALNPNGPFTRVTAQLVKDTSFTDHSVAALSSTYMVRAVKLETSASGTYYNASEGTFTTPVPSAVASAGAARSVNANDRSISRDSRGATERLVAPATPTGNGTNAVRVLSPTGATALTNNTVWFDDALPTGALGSGDQGDSWNWVSSNPSPASGAMAHQSSASTGFHQHYFASATKTLAVNPGDTMVAYVYVDPANVPSELMLQWNDGSSWEHRAYWGANRFPWGTDGTTSMRYMGPVPTAGQWVRLEVPASQVGLEGVTLNGMAFTLYDGRVTWDAAGKAAVILTNTPATGTATNNMSWVDDALPTGALSSADGDTWNWVTSNPSPEAGARSHQSAVLSGLHQHFFTSATTTLAVNPGDNLYAYVYIDPANVPSELMLQWNNGSWEHRAYWGANNVSYGADASAARHYMGPLPISGQWVRLEVPASQVGLEGSSLNGMAFTLYDGRATWDDAGKSTVSITTSTNVVSGGNTNSTGTNVVSGGTTNSTGGGTNVVSVGSTNSTEALVVTTTNLTPGLTAIDYATLGMPAVGTNALHILTPSILELDYINTKAVDPATVSTWNIVDASANLLAPPASAFTVTVNGQQVAVTSVGFKRHPIYAPFWFYDLRIQNSLYLQLATPVSDNQTVKVTNPSQSLFPSAMQFAATSDPLRYSPAVHASQEGYMPGYTKKAMVGYYMGSLGEMPIPSSSGFKLVDAASGATVFQGNLAPRGDNGWAYSPAPYQKVYEADFTAFNTPGEYRLVVPGMGGSLPFLIDSGVAMAFARAYSLGLYHQRCGTNTAMPYTRFEHDACHTAAASVPWPAANYNFTWTTVANYGLVVNSDNPVQTAPKINANSQLFPFVRQGTIDTAGGHHDAGDYSKYTANSANLIHYLVFAADSLPGVGQLDNLGIPESGDGISDVLQEAKWEADFIAKLQDSDGGFYFLVYPVNREYEGGVSLVAPNTGDPQVVWPKTTSVTAAAVAALAQCASSPAFKKAYPAVAAQYLQKAQLGWQFLKNAINNYGKNGAYQKITHYSDEYADQDELAWAACQIFLATGDQDAHQKLLAWFNPSDPATWRWGWWHLPVCYGHAVRSYAFAVQSGRVASASQLDATFLAKCQAEVAAAGDYMMTASQQSAYGTSFPQQTKAVRAAGWYFSCDNAFDIATAYALNPKLGYMDAMVANMNYEGGCNPVNVTFVTGLGWKRNREIVNQWAPLDREVMPPSGIPVGNIAASFFYISTYGTEVEELVYPGDNATTAPYPYYDRWQDGWNVSAEFTIQNSARALGTLSMLAAQGAVKTQAWTSVAAIINVPANTVPLNQPVTVSLQAPSGVDLSSARIVWEARDQEPAFGSTFTFTPSNSGAQWVEAEAQMPDGRRIFAKSSFNANSPSVAYFDDSLPPGALLGADGEAWNWVSSNPAPNSGSLAHQSALTAGVHQHYFYNATATLSVSPGDLLYAWIYLDPANLPSEVMLQWNDGTGWEHRAYWGANNIAYGVNGTASQYPMGPLPAAGQWVQLSVQASKVGLEGKTINGMAFTLYGGRATWDSAGRITPASATPAVTVKSAVATASRLDQQPGVFTFTRTGDTNAALTVNFALGGSAATGVDYQPAPAGVTASSVTFAAGAGSTNVLIVPNPATNIVGSQNVVLTLASNAAYAVSTPNSAVITLGGNTIRPTSFTVPRSGPTITWNSTSGKVYRVAFKNNLSDAQWTPIAGDVTATSSVSRFVDTTAGTRAQRFYLLGQVQ